MIGILEEFLRTILTVQFSAHANVKTESNEKLRYHSYLLPIIMIFWKRILRARTAMVFSANTQLKRSRSQSCLRHYKDFLEEFLLLEEYLA